MADDLGTQLGIQNEINKVLVAREAIMKRNASLLQGQAQLAKELCNALRCENLDGIEERLQGIRDAMEDAAGAAEEAGRQFTEATDALNEGLDESVSKINKTSKTFRSFGLETTKVIGGAVFGAFNSVFNIIAGIGGAVSRGFSNLISTADEGARAGRQLAEAFEDVRDKFGDLSVGEGKLVTQAFNGISAAAEKAGVNIGSKFGAFVEGAVNRLNAMAKTMEDLGGLAPLLSKQFSEDLALSIFTVTQGLGVSAEALQSLGNRALLSGNTLQGVLDQTAHSVNSVAKEIGVSAKTLGKNFDAIAKDVTNFGNLSVQELTNLAAVVTETGISISTLQGITQKFDQFDSAAESVAKLTQAFGMNLNTIDLLNASTEERTQMIKSSFMEQGRAISDLSRQERAYLAQATGIADTDLERVFGNQAGAIDETASAAERAQQAQIDTAKTLQDIAKNIKEIFKPLQEFGGFLDAFAEGVDRAFRERGVLSPLVTAMDEVNNIGLRTGNSLANIFNNEELDQTLKSVTDSMIEPFRFVETFVKEIEKGASFEEAFGKLLDDMLNYAVDQIVRFADFANMAVDKIDQVLRSAEVSSKITQAFEKIAGALEKLGQNPVVQKALGNAGKALAVLFGGSFALNFLTTLPATLMSGLGLMFTVGGPVGKAFSKGM